MSEYDRNRIDVALARRLIDGQFPQWSSLPVREVELDGWDNRTFRLGSELSIRLPTGEWYAKQVEKEHRWLPVLAPQLPLPIPAPVARGAPDGDYPFPWSVYRWLDGEPAATAPVGDLVRDGRLAAVLDFGTSGVGDPACDMVIAWTFLEGPSRDRFRTERGVDPGTWARGRGWALWKALITDNLPEVERIVAN